MSELMSVPTPLKNDSEIKAEQWDFFEKAKVFVKGNNRYFLQTLVRFANREHCCWRTIENFADEMGVGEKTVRRAIQYLEELELIVVIRKRGGIGRSHPNVYMLNMECEKLDAVSVTNAQVLEAVTTTATQSLDMVTVTDTQPLDAVTLTEACGQLTKKENKKESKTSGDAVIQSIDMRSHSPRDTVTVTAKYKYNINKNINSGGASELLPDGEEIFNCSNSDLMNFWTYIKGFVKRTSKRTLPSKPSQRDLDSMLWAIGEFSVDPQAKEDCISMCKFVIDELGETEAVLNPLVRLQMAANEHPSGISRFYDRYMGFGPVLS
ncbi:helix-turn-helix domain-containing protein [Vibrio parahaemolyticus]|nr:helix-turn-helix domain-containing protein [Vibrio parahaemolyticus]